MKASMRARRMDRSHRRMKKQSRLNLVSLMDIFTILVFFLMVNSGDVEVLQADKEIKLPESTAEVKPDITLVLKISDSDVILQGRKIVSVEQALSSPGDVIAALDTELQYQASRKPVLTELEQDRGRAVTIMGDQQMPYRLLKRVMTTCARANYRDISLAVNKLPAAEPDQLPGAQQASEIQG